MKNCCKLYVKNILNVKNDLLIFYLTDYCLSRSVFLEEVLLYSFYLFISLAIYKRFFKIIFMKIILNVNHVLTLCNTGQHSLYNVPWLYQRSRCGILDLYRLHILAGNSVSPKR